MQVTQGKQGKIRKNEHLFFVELSEFLYKETQVLYILTIGEKKYIVFCQDKIQFPKFEFPKF